MIRVLYKEQVAADENSQYFMRPYPLPMPAVSAPNRERSKTGWIQAML